MRFLHFLSLIIFLLFSQFCSKSTPEKGIMIERIQASASAKGSNPINVFVSGKSWSPKTDLDGVTIFFSNADKWQEKGKTEGRAFFDAMSITCTVKEGNISLYRDGSSIASSNCADSKPQSIGKTGTHVIYVLPSPGVGIEDISFYKDGKKLDVFFPEPIQGEVTASSIVEPKESYPPFSLFDGSTDFGWVEGVKGDGIGEWFQVDLEKEITISGIELFNGYQRLDVLFQKNGVVTEMQVSNGKDSYTFNVDDQQGGQRIFFPKPMKGDKFKFTISKVRIGSVWKDTVIAEVILLGEKGKRYSVIDKTVDITEESLLSKIKNTPLEKSINVAFVSESPDGRLDYVFRSNGSFVIWKDTADESRVFDGNWIIRKLSPDEAKIYIFGRDHKIATVESIGDSGYSDSYEEESTVMFRDTMQVTYSAEEGAIFAGEKITLSKN